MDHEVEFKCQLYENEQVAADPRDPPTTGAVLGAAAPQLLKTATTLTDLMEAQGESTRWHCPSAVSPAHTCTAQFLWLRASRSGAMIFC